MRVRPHGCGRGVQLPSGGSERALDSGSASVDPESREGLAEHRPPVSSVQSDGGENRSRSSTTSAAM
jgi:hypothetical protein